MSCACGGECGGNCVGEVEISPVDVHLGHVVVTKELASDYGSYATFSFAGTTSDMPQRILNYDAQRARAIIQSDAAVWIGSKGQIANGSPAGWKQTNTLQPLTIRNRQEVWAMSIVGTPVNVMVLNERWEDDER